MRLLFVAMLLLGAGCAAPYQVVHATPGGPLGTPTPVTVFPVSYSGLEVGRMDEAAYVSEKDNAVGWAEKKARWGERLRQAVVDAAAGRSVTAAGDAGSGLVLEVRIPFIEPGFEVGVMGRPSRTRAVGRLRLAGSDEVLYEVTCEASHGGLGDRVGDDHAALGAALARFLNDQLAPRQ